MRSKILQSRRGVLILSAFLISFYVQSQPYYLTSPPGYAAGTTGGGTPSSSNTVTVTTSSQLLSALTGSASVILVSGTITTSRLSAVVTNKTILGLPGAKLVNLNQTQSGSGILHLQEGSNNVIIRNLKFEGPGAYDVDGWDLLTNKGCDYLWVDHCEFQDGVDCLYDNTNNSDNITVTWCKFYNAKPPVAGGSGGSDDHRFANLVGGSDSDVPTDGRYSITWAYNWWGSNIKARMVRARNAQLHILNCYWSSQIASANIGLTAGVNGSTCYVESGVFECTGTILDYNSGCSAVFDNCIGGVSNVGSVSAPSYSYTEISAGSVKSAVTNASCGAGATLQVSSSGVISTSCGGSSCSPTLITPYVQVNGGTWQQASSISVASGSTVKFGPQPSSGGAWSWSGCGVSGSSREQTFTATSSCTATAIYTNSCGAQSSMNFYVTVTGTATTQIEIQENQTGFCSVEGTVDSNNAGFTGTGFANTSNASGAGVNWSVNIPSTGSYTLRWRYSNGGGTARPGNVKVDGSTITTASFDATTNWTTWVENSSSQVTITLPAGTRTIRLEATTSSGLANIDMMVVSGVNPQVVSCGSARMVAASELITATTEGTKVYPNPVNVGEKITIQLSERAETIELLGISGAQINKMSTGGALKVEMESPVSRGIYILKVYSGRKVHAKKLLIR